MDERAKQKEARQIEKERKAMEREEKVKKKDKQKKEKQRAIKKPTGRKEILNLGDKDNTQCSFCEVFYQDDVTGDSWQGIQLILIMESDKNAQIYVCGCDWEAMNLDEFKSQLHPLDKQPNTNLVEKHGKLIDDERHETTWQVDELVDDVEDGEVKESEEENEQGKSNCDNKRRIYERDFLLSLQFLEQCKQRPLNLGNAAYIRKVPLQPSDIQVGLSCHDNISGAGRKKKSRYIMPSRKKRKLHTNNEQAGLENAEEHWEEMDTHELFRKLVEILDQLTAQNVEILADQIIQLPINSEDRLKGCVDRIFNVAIEQDKLSVACAQLSKILSSKLIKIETGCQGKRITFYNLLLAKCRQEFGKDKKSDIVVVELMKKIEEAATPVEKKELEKELSERKYQLQSNYLGNIKFIGELFKVKIVSIKLIHKYIKRLLQSTTDEEALEGFAKLMLTMGRLLKNKERDKVLIKQYMDRVRIIIVAEKISSRIISLLLDVGKHIKHRLLSRTTPPILPAQQLYMQERQPLHYATGITPIPSSLHLHRQPYQGIAAHQYYPPQPQMTPVYLDTTALLDHSPLLETSTYLHHFSDHQRQPYTAMAPPASHSARAKPPKIVDPLAMKEVETSKMIKSDLHQLLQNISLISGDCNCSEL